MRALITSLILTSIIAPTSLADHESLRVFTWEEYFDPDLVAVFEQKHGVRLEFIYYNNDEVRDQVMAETSGYGFDVILVDEIELAAYIQQQWIKPIEYTKLKNLDEHGDKWKQLTPSADGYAVPYGWGTYGIAYRADLLSKAPTKWADLFNPTDALLGFIQMPPQASELLVIALMAQGNSPATSDSQKLTEAYNLLLNQKAHVKTYQTPNFDEDLNLLNQGLTKAAVTYSSDALFLQDEFENIEYVSPSDGTILWIDYWTISAQSHKVDLAYKFFDFLLEAQVSAKNTEYHYTATFSSKAKSLLPTEIRENKVIFMPNIEDLNTMQVPTRQRLRTMMKIINNLEID